MKPRLDWLASLLSVTSGRNQALLITCPIPSQQWSMVVAQSSFRLFTLGGKRWMVREQNKAKGLPSSRTMSLIKQQRLRDNYVNVLLCPSQTRTSLKRNVKMKSEGIWIHVSTHLCTSYCTASRPSTTWPLHISLTSCTSSNPPAPSDPPPLSTLLCPPPASKPHTELSAALLWKSLPPDISNTDSLYHFGPLSVFIDLLFTIIVFVKCPCVIERCWQIKCIIIITFYRSISVRECGGRGGEGGWVILHRPAFNWDEETESDDWKAWNVLKYTLKSTKWQTYKLQHFGLLQWQLGVNGLFWVQIDDMQQEHTGTHGWIRCNECVVNNIRNITQMPYIYIHIHRMDSWSAKQINMITVFFKLQYQQRLLQTMKWECTQKTMWTAITVCEFCVSMFILSVSKTRHKLRLYLLFHLLETWDMSWHKTSLPC